MVDAGLIVLVSFISPFRAERRMARALFADGRVPRGVRRHAARRWPRSATSRASTRRRAAASSRTSPASTRRTKRRSIPEIRIDTTKNTSEQSAEAIVEYLQAGRVAQSGAVSEPRCRRPIRSFFPGVERRARAGQQAVDPGRSSRAWKGRHALGKNDPDRPLALPRLRLFRSGGKERAALATSISHPRRNPLPPGRERSAAGRVRIHASDPASPVAIVKTRHPTVAGGRSGTSAPSACLPFQARGKVPDRPPATRTCLPFQARDKAPDRPPARRHSIENGTMRRSFVRTVSLRPSGGNARWWQSGRSQMRQLTPTGTAAPSRLSPSE